MLLQKGQIGNVETWMLFVPDCSANPMDEPVKQDSAYSGSASLWVMSLNNTIFKNFFANANYNTYSRHEKTGLDLLVNVSRVKTWWIIM